MNRLLPRKAVAKPWGRAPLPPAFGASGTDRIGEVWFEPPAELEALLVKHIFTSEALSVQVHPADAQSPDGRGKEECWLVIEAEPGARLGIGFTREVSPEEMRAAALDGSIEQLLDWYPVSAGDFFYIPAGTVHAIGAGVHIVEVQQNSDITYRLYDYGRPRELHLDAALAVARRGPLDPARHLKLEAEGEVLLVDGLHFRLARLDGRATGEIAARFTGPAYAIALDSPISLAALTIEPGDAALADDISALEPMGRCLVAQPCG